MPRKSRFIEMTSVWNKRGVIQDIVDVNIAKAGKQFAKSDIIQYIDISSVDSETNQVTTTTEYKLSDAPSRAQQCTKHGDILVSTVRPNLKNIAVNQLFGDNMVASSGFCVLRPKVGCQGLLLAYVLSEPFTKKMVAEAKGSNYPAIHDSDVLSYPVMIPSESELEKVDCFMKQADKSKFTDFKSRFIEMFGTPENNHRCFPITNLGKLCEIVGRIGFRGYTRNDLVENECDGAISLSPSNIIDGELDYTNCTYVSWEKYNESPEIMINEGDIVLVKTASVGKCALVKILPHETTINPQFVVLKQLQINPFYLNTCLQGDYGQRCIKSYTSGSTIPTFTQKQLATMAIIVPPYEKQKEFEVIIRQSDKSKYLS